MIAHINVGFAFFEVLLTIKFITDKRKLAKYPRPNPEKGISQPTKSFAQYKRNGKSG